nr:reverse transcriptase domain-containing protein [Tanacetum cinerariifolium]
MLAVVYAFEKFRPYLVLSKSIVYTYHSALKYLLNHLSRLENPHKDVFENKDINENFPLETIGKISSGSTPWFVDFVNFHAGNFIVKWMSSQQKKKFFKDVRHYFWDDPYLFRFLRIKSFDGVCMAKKLMIYSKLVKKDPPKTIMVLILPLRKDEMPQTGIQVCKIFDVCGIDFMGPFPSLRGNRTAYKTPIGCTPYKLFYGKSCHLPIELEHKAYWALKHANFDLKTTGDHRKLQLNELRDQAYENSLIYKEKTKKLQDSKIKNRIFNVEGLNFKVNGHRVKHYFGGDIPQLVVLDLQTFPMDK